jgi:hypothetical protein
VTKSTAHTVVEENNDLIFRAWSSESVCVFGLGTIFAGGGAVLNYATVTVMM